MSAPQTLPDELAEEALGMTPSDDAGDSLALRIPRPGRRLVWLFPLVLAIAAAGLALVNHRRDADQAGAETARTVVTDHVKSLLTYSYQDIRTDLAAEKGWLTGPFADSYAELVSTKIEPAAAKAKVSTAATIASAGVVSAQHDRVQLLLFVNISTRSSQLSQPRVSGSRLLVTADLVDGEWRISALDPV
jgi:Mce-associated membrane protein